ncbi:MAG TPA: cation diffusion facilitator family transporter [bacterium]|nr:cation diffusion facilitator family transporter [bacterium]HPN30375.1 cation diffusion facilitator family transporter [bacterium]
MINFKDKRVYVTIKGAILNILLALFKIAAGIYARSQALIADGIHTLSDLVSDIIVLFGIILGDIPKDDTHNYGHKKIETLSEIILGIMLAGVSIYIGMESAIAIYRHPEISRTGLQYFIALVSAFLSIALKEYLYRITVNIGKETKNTALIANAWHHRSDALSSIPVFIGLIIIYFFPSLHYIDSYLGLLICFIILKIGVSITFESLKKIIDTAPSKEIKEKICNIIEQNKEIKNYHNIRMRYIGNQLFIDMHIRVDKNWTVIKSHDIATELKKNIMKKIENIYDVLIHIEPD